MFIVVTIIAWIIIKIVSFYFMYKFGSDIGIDPGVIQETRRTEFNHMNNIIGVGRSLMLTAAFSVILLISLLQGRNND